MHDATARLEEIRELTEALAADALAGRVYLPEVGRVQSAGLLVGSIIEGRRRSLRRVPATLGGMDRSVPAGDRA